MAALSDGAARVIPPGFQDIDQAVSNTAILVDSHFLTWPVKAHIRYAYESLIVYEADAAARFRFRVVLPPGAVMAADAVDADVVETAAGFEVILQAAYGEGVPLPHRTRGFIHVGGESGDVRIQFGQGAAHPAATTLRRGSWIRLEQLRE